MENINVYSPIEDKTIKANLSTSPIWKQAYHEEEIVSIMGKFPNMFKYTIKFDGLKPVQVTNVQKVK